MWPTIIGVFSVGCNSSYSYHAPVMNPPSSPRLEVFQMHTNFNPLEILRPTMWTYVEYCGLRYSFAPTLLYPMVGVWKSAQ